MKNIGKRKRKDFVTSYEKCEKKQSKFIFRGFKKMGQTMLIYSFESCLMKKNARLINQFNKVP